MKRAQDETSIEFSERVKAYISETAGLTNLSWDGYLKNYRPTREKQDKMRLETRQEYLKELDQKLVCQDHGGCDHSDGEEQPILPEKDYLPDWLSDDERMALQNELLQGSSCSQSSNQMSFDQKLNRSRDNLGKKFKELKETFSPNQSGK